MTVSKIELQTKQKLSQFSHKLNPKKLFCTIIAQSFFLEQILNSTPQIQSFFLAMAIGMDSFLGHFNTYYCIKNITYILPMDYLKG